MLRLPTVHAGVVLVTSAMVGELGGAMAEVVISGGVVVDGTGAPSRPADVRIIDGRIAEIGAGLDASTGANAIVLDATGCVVAPGFIDIHTHYDAQVFWDPALTPSSWHGVTTVVAGNCGFSIAPLRRCDRDAMVETMQVVEDMNPETLRDGVPWDEFETYPEYLDAIEARGVRLNYAGYIGHTAVRLYVMGDDAFERAATTDELHSMQLIIGEALESGAIGFSSSSNPTHRGAGGRPVPSRAADVEELLALVEPLRDADAGVISLLAGEKISYGDVYTVQRHARRPLTWTPMLVMPGFDHEAWLNRNHEARAAGQDVWAQSACRPIVFQENLHQPFTLHRFGSFAELPAGLDERMAMLTDPAWRARAEAEVNIADRGLVWSAMTIAECERRPGLLGRAITDIAAERNCSPFTAMVDVSIEDRLATRFNVAVANHDVAEVGSVLSADGVLIGLADSGAHVGQLCDACFATDLLATWTRERGVFDIETAVHKLSGEPAAFLGLSDRGVLAAGYAADVCVFDPATVAPGPVRRIADFPADGERLVADRPSGVRHVLVNGTVIRRDGEDLDTESRPGQVLRGRKSS